MHASIPDSPVISDVRAEGNEQSPVANVAPRGHWLSAAVLCLMAATMVALFWFPVRRMFANVEVNYNEGWNAYRAAWVANRIPLYAKPPQSFGTGTAYPPLSFHLIGLLGGPDTFVEIGRWISLLSLIAAGILLALVVRRGGGSAQAAIFSFFLYEIGIALLLPNRIGMNDPQLLGEALSIAGFYLYIRNPVSTRLLCASALLFCLSGFTKHTLLVFPAVVAIDLLFRSRKAFLTWASAMVLCAGLFFGLTFLVDGRFFLLHLMSKRTYSYWRAWSQYHAYAVLFQGSLVVATAWMICAFRSRRLVASAFLLSHLLAFLLGGGAGVDMNIFFNAWATTVLACSFALSDITFELAAWRPAIWNSAGAFAFALFFISIMVFVPGQLRRDREKARALLGLESEFRSAVESTKSRSGPALCESLLLCYEAGKAFEYEPFSVRDELKTGQVKEDDVLQMLRTHHFQTVEINLRSVEENLNWPDLRTSLTSDQTDPDTVRNFTPSFLKELVADYHLEKRTSQMALFAPN